MSALRGMSNFRNCTNQNCADGQLHDTGDDQPIMTCKRCGTQSCFTDDVTWHTGYTCAAYEVLLQERRRAEESSTLKMVKKDKNIKKCPECGVLGVKVSACDHITCKLLSTSSPQACLPNPPFSKPHLLCPFIISSKTYSC